MKKRMSIIKKWGVNIAYYCCIVFLTLLFARVFLFAHFRVPSSSMHPTIKRGNQLLVNKLSYGARIFDIFDVMTGKRTKVYRIQGIGKIKRNDVIVFHFPYPESKKEIKMNLNKFFVKRCIGLPGDSLSIKNGFYKVKGCEDLIGYIQSQRLLSKKKDSCFNKDVFYSIQPNSNTRWTIKNMGDIYIPKKGDKLNLNNTNFLIYKNLIEWELETRVKNKNGKLYLNSGKILNEYTFSHNYYFMAGDNVFDSQDSRYWGLLPDEFIVGKVWLIW